DFAAGQLTIDRLAGSDKLIEGTLSLVTSRKPTWGIDRSGGQVTMSLGYEPGQAPTGLSWGKGEEWHLRLAPKVGFDLDLSMGAGDARLELTGLDVRSLKVQAGAGATTIV